MWSDPSFKCRGPKTGRSGRFKEGKESESGWRVKMWQRVDWTETEKVGQTLGSSGQATGMRGPDHGVLSTGLKSLVPNRSGTSLKCFNQQATQSHLRLVKMILTGVGSGLVRLGCVQAAGWAVLRYFRGLRVGPRMRMWVRMETNA